MKEPSFRIPFLIDSPPVFDSNGCPQIPQTPTHIASWTSSTSSGPYARLALSTSDNSIYIYTFPPRPLPSPSAIPPPPPCPAPTHLSPNPARYSPGSPKHPRSSGSRNPSISGRSRAASSASSILTGTGASRRRVSALSPPGVSHQLPLVSATITSATAIQDIGPRHSVDREELIEQLKEQRGPDKEDNERHLGLGIAGLGRRGLQVHGKEELESGSSTPRSSVSTRRRTGKEKEELKERIEEIEVEREMQIEMEDEKREIEDQKVVANARRRSSGARERLDKVEKTDKEAVEVVRIVLRRPGEGKIVSLEVKQEIEALCVLRDTGILDIISLPTLQVTASIDLEAPDAMVPSDIATSSKTILRVPPFWQWRGISVASKGDTPLLVLNGLPWPSPLPTPSGEVTRVVMLSQDYHEKWQIAARLELPGEGDVGVCSKTESSFLLHATPTSLLSYPILFPSETSSFSESPLPPSTSSHPSPLLPAILRPTTPEPPAVKRTASHTSLRDVPHAAPKPEKGFAKFLAARRADWGGANVKGKETADEGASVGIGEGSEVERDGYGAWKRIKMQQNEGVGFGEHGVDLFWCDGQTLKVRGRIEPSGTAEDVRFLEGWKNIAIKTSEGLRLYASDTTRTPGGRLLFSEGETYPEATQICLDQHNDLLFLDNEAVQSVSLARNEVSIEKLIVIGRERHSARVSHLRPLDPSKVFTSDDKGNVHKQILSDVLQDISPSSQSQMSADRLDSPITYMDSFHCENVNGGKVLAAGDEDGVIRIWDAETLALKGSWTLFDHPVHAVYLLDMPEAGILVDCLLCVAQDGTIGVISLKEMDSLFLIPASRAALKRVFVGGKDILLAYANGKARVWNVETREFRRSTALEAAEDMLQSGSWAEVLIPSTSSQNVPISAYFSPTPASDINRLLELDVRELSKWMHQAQTSPLAILRALLSIFLTFGLNDTIDDVCRTKLGIEKPLFPVAVGTQGIDGSVILRQVQGMDCWKVSPASTGMRQLVIVSLLRPFLDSPDCERWAAEVMAFYTASLPTGLVEPDLELFAEYYLDSASNVHQAARMLFAARLARMSDDDIETLVSSKQSDLPSLHPASHQESEVCARALTMIGGIGLHKYQSMSPSSLKAVSDSLVVYLNNPACPHLVLAIELCSKGFPTWQTYVDPMDLLRRLFSLSTQKIPQAAQARLAVLHVASNNAPLFMSTLSMDILDAKTVEGRKSIMKLCVFMARKKPEVLENGLPRIAEAVVKSLDPNVGKMRDDVWEAATVILNELVLAFSTIDFHSGTQRLAVGTHEGAVIMYDLKSASRLYVLEPHKHPVSSVNFSPDGRRLVTVSLDEGSVTVWKVGSSLSGFFNVGGPPRQGADKGEPFKRIDFMRVDDGPVGSISALSDVQVTWPGARQARVMIKETALTFAT